MAFKNDKLTIKELQTQFSDAAEHLRQSLENNKALKLALKAAEEEVDQLKYQKQQMLFYVVAAMDHLKRLV